MRRILSLALSLGFIPPAVSLHAADTQPVDLANPLVGTASLDDPKLLGNAPPPGEEAYTGLVWPGPALPHHGVLLNPVNKDLDSANVNHGIICSYNHSRPTMIGFSSVVPGMTLMPLVGDWTTPPDRGYAAAYDKNSETASPGYYSVYFPSYQVRAELTTTEHTGLYRFTFPKSDRSVILMDLGAGNSGVKIVGDNMICGTGEDARRNGGQTFVVEFSKPFKSFGTFHQNVPAEEGSRVLRGDLIYPDSRSVEGGYAGCYLNFSTTNGEQILVRIAAGKTVDEARAKLNAEDSGWDFDGAWKQVRNIWANKLDLIQIKGGTDHERRFFYSAYYHCFYSPRLIAKRGAPFRDLNGERQVADYDRYTGVPFWDTGRDQITLLMLLEPDLITNVLQTHLEMARESGWMDTSFHGDNAVFLYLGCWERGYNFDWAAVYPFLRKNAMDPSGPRGCLAEYLTNGWIHDIVVDNPSPPYADGNAGAATTLEYAWDDYAMALYAKKLGLEDDYRMFLARAHNYTNVFDSRIGFMRGRQEDGSWISPFDPQEPYYNFMMKEANGWQTLWLVPHDVQGLINLLGGREKFCAKLDEFFSTPYHPKGIARDVTGLIGQYCQGNQPDRQTPYYYDYAGQPWKTQKLVREILTELYGSDKAGLAYPGMDDQGSTSSWYVLSALGFFATNPARPEYLIGSPLFDRVTIHMGEGKDFEIIAHHNSAQNCYIQSAKLNGHAWNKPWFSHSDIANGGRLELVMGPQPNVHWGSAADDAPPSMTHW
ncbi:MAG TPA: GH92 family glycosyl hydrolase [Verrucomicrobiae bacterium]|nr:GH92 family glycosyl hydrolase [Verrucomicrobiae bacterium]